MQIKHKIRRIIDLMDVIDVTAPKEASILIYDQNSVEEIKPYLGSFDYVVLPTRQEKIYLFALLPAICGRILLGKCLYSSYVDAFIHRVKPSVIVTTIDNDTRFYTISLRHPKSRTVMIQNGLRSRNMDVLSKLKPGFYQRKVDYMMMFGDSISQLYGNLIQGTCISMGSLRANKYFWCTPTPNSLPKTVVCISNWRRRKLGSDFFCLSEDGKPVSHQKFYEANKILFNHCQKWCNLNGYNLLLLSSQKKDSKYLDEEKEFYGLNESSDTETYYVSKNEQETYELIKQSCFNVGVDSTLLLESLAAGLRTVFFQVRGELLGWPDWNFGWPLNLDKEGSYWTSSTSYERFSEIAEFVVRVEASVWSKTVDKARKSIIEYDPGNTILTQLIQDLLSHQE